MEVLISYHDQIKDNIQVTSSFCGVSSRWILMTLSRGCGLYVLLTTPGLLLMDSQWCQCVEIISQMSSVGFRSGKQAGYTISFIVSSCRKCWHLQLLEDYHCHTSEGPRAQCSCRWSHTGSEDLIWEPQGSQGSSGLLQEMPLQIITALRQYHLLATEPSALAILQAQCSLANPSWSVHCWAVTGHKTQYWAPISPSWSQFLTLLDTEGHYVGLFDRGLIPPLHAQLSCGINQSPGISSMF